MVSPVVEGVTRIPDGMATIAVDHTTNWGGSVLHQLLLVFYLRGGLARRRQAHSTLFTKNERRAKKPGAAKEKLHRSGSLPNFNPDMPSQINQNVMMLLTNSLSRTLQHGRHLHPAKFTPIKHLQQPAFLRSQIPKETIGS